MLNNHRCYEINRHLISFILQTRIKLFWKGDRVGMTKTRIIPKLSPCKFVSVERSSFIKTQSHKLSLQSIQILSFDFVLFILFAHFLKSLIKET